MFGFQRQNEASIPTHTEETLVKQQSSQRWILLLLLTGATLAVAPGSRAQDYVRDSEPKLFSYDELVQLSLDQPLTPELTEKLHAITTTPFINNEAYYAGSRPRHAAQQDAQGQRELDPHEEHQTDRECGVLRRLNSEPPREPTRLSPPKRPNLCLDWSNQPTKMTKSGPRTASLTILRG